MKIYATILDSSVWLEAAPTRLVWITMLTMADKDGIVRASVGGLAHRANVVRDQCVTALDTLAAPDPDSKSAEHEGRRIEKLDGGWLILNYQRYRELRTDDQIAAAVRQRRKRQRDASRDGTSVTTEAEVEAEAKAESSNSSFAVPALESFRRRFYSASPPDSARWLRILSQLNELAIEHGHGRVEHAILAVVAKGPKDPRAAMKWVRLKLSDPELDAKGRTKTEAESDRWKAEESVTPRTRSNGANAGDPVVIKSLVDVGVEQARSKGRLRHPAESGAGDTLEESFT